jgi:hypothetical protein
MKTSRLGAALLQAHVVDEKFDPADYSVVVKLRGAFGKFTVPVKLLR